MLYADLTAKIDEAGGMSPTFDSERAAEMAAVVLAAARSESGSDADRLIHLADTVGIDTLGQVWQNADPVSLAGALWTLYLLRHWCQSQPFEVLRIWRAGESGAEPDVVVAGLGWHPDTDSVRSLGDAILRGAFRGEFAVALERGAAFFRVVAHGRRELARDVANAADRNGELAERNDRIAGTLTTAAALWRKDALS